MGLKVQKKEKNIELKTDKLHKLRNFKKGLKKIISSNKKKTGEVKIMLPLIAI